MEFYLSSYQLGNDASILSRLVVGDKRIGVIRNALDFSTDTERLHEGKKQEFKALESLGLTPVELDLRDYFGEPELLKKQVSQLDALWVVGGNSFLLNHAFHESGLKDILISRLGDDRFVYAGYSAGICVLTPTLRGIDLVDDPGVKAAGYPDDLSDKAIGILPFSIAPHWKSDHPESVLIDKTIAYFMKFKMPFIALQDGEVYTATIKEMPDNVL